MNQRHPDPQALLELYALSPEDLDRIRKYGALVLSKLDRYVELFYKWLETQPEFEEHFSDREQVHRVGKLQIQYWKEFFEAKVDEQYVERRSIVGTAHARIGLSLQAYFAAMNASLVLFLDELYDGSLPAEAYKDSVRSLTKLVHLDTAVVVQTYSDIINHRISEQSRSLMEMSTPVTSIWEGILLLPVVGIIDSRRAQEMMNTMLTKIAEARARKIILDISGVAILDTAVANHLIKITKATKLMGCECTISGVSPAIAQTIVELGIDVGTVRTTATLSGALDDAFEALGVVLQSPAGKK